MKNATKTCNCGCCSCQSKPQCFFGAAIIFVIGIAIGLIIFKYKNPTTTLTPPATSTITPTSTTEIFWQTYKNKKLGVEFQHPKDWAIDESSTNEKTITMKSQQYIGFSVTTELQGVGVQCFKENQEKESINIDGIQAIKQTLVSDSSGGLCDGTENERMEWVYLTANNKRYDIIFRFKENEFVNVSQFFTQILSTFKFTDSNSSTLQTYQNTKYGIEFKYPNDYELTENCTYQQSGSSECDNYYISVMKLTAPAERKGYLLKDDELKIEVHVSKVITPIKSISDLQNFSKEKITQEGNQKIISQKVININGTSIINYDVGDTMNESNVYYTSKGNYVYLITRYPYKTSLVNEFTQILSTFKFTN